MAVAAASACSPAERTRGGVDGGDDLTEGADSTADVAAGESPDDADAADAPDEPSLAPPGVPRLSPSRPFDVPRAVSIGDGLEASARDAFTARMLAFYRATDIFTWTHTISHGVADDNPWGEPSYMFWWQGVEVLKQGDLVTFVHEGGADNMMSHHGRVFGPLVGAWLTLPTTPATDDLRALVLGYIRGVSATFDGSIWADEDPVVPTIMARAIFHRNHAWTLPGGRNAAVDYDLERVAVVQRRHDTVHNPANPIWGDVWVRNKRSKDDLPWVYRMQAHLAQILHTVEGDDELRAAALKLHDQLRAFAQDVLDNGYVIRSKGPDGEVFIPLVAGDRVVDDFASMVEFEALVPNGECNAKLPIALLATGEAQGNDCGDGQLTAYEEVGLARFYGHTWMQWNFHLSAAVTSLLYGDHDAARALLIGFGARMDALTQRDDHISRDARFDADVAQTLVLAATWGMPLTTDEARLVTTQYTAAADHLQAWPLWNLWDASVADGMHPYLPGLSHEDATRAHIHIEEMFNLFEYCASPVRALDGAQFVDCEALTAEAAWR